MRMKIVFNIIITRNNIAADLGLIDLLTPNHDILLTLIIGLIFYTS